MHSRKHPRIEPKKRRKRERNQDAGVDLLILSDGTVLIHNLTPAMAAILNEINPRDETLQPRASARRR